MPLAPFLTILFAAILAGGLTVWLVAALGQTALMIALPLFMIAATAMFYFRK